MEEDNLNQLMNDITAKIDELSNAIKTGKENVEIESKQVTKLKERVEDIKNRFEEAKKGAIEKKIDIENKIKINPLPYLVGAFIGGLIIGRLGKMCNDK